MPGFQKLQHQRNDLPLRFDAQLGVKPDSFQLSFRAYSRFNIRHMKIVLAYSGGLDTSVLLSWIKEKYSAEMIAFCANIGQEDELTGLAAKAKKTGAAKIYIDDLQEEFAPNKPLLSTAKNGSPWTLAPGMASWRSC